MFTRLLLFRLRRDRSQLIGWGVALLLLQLIVVADVKQTFGTVTERADTLKVLLVTPAVLMFRGTPQGTSEGDLVAVLGLAFVALLVGLMSTFLVVRHTRAEEERGQSETIAATAAGRLVPSLAVVSEAVIANAVATVAIAIGCLAGGLPAGGSWLFAAGSGMTGLAFVGVALVLAQLMPTSRSANGWSATLVIVAYFLRGIGDAAGTPHPASYTLTPAWPSWVSPIGWAQLTLPWGQNRVWPLFISLGLFLVLGGVALLVQDRRDVGAGVFAERNGRFAASVALRGPFGLAARLERGGLIGWVAGLVALAALLGGLSGAIVEQLDSAGPGVATAIDELGGANGTVIQAFANLGAIFSGLLASAICVQGAMRLRQEESAAAADLVLSTATGRARWMLSHLVVAALGAAVALVLGGLISGAVAGSAGGGFAAWFGGLLWQLPAALVFLGFVALVFAVLPQATVGVGWAVFALAAFLSLFGPLIGLPGWAQKLTPFTQVPAIALPHPSFLGGWVLTAAAVALAAAAVLLFRRRDTRPVG